MRVIKKAFVGRSYYVERQTGGIRLELGLPEQLLKKRLLSIAVSGQAAMEIRDLQPAMTAAIPLEALAAGSNAVDLRILRKTDRNGSQAA